MSIMGLCIEVDRLVFFFVFFLDGVGLVGFSGTDFFLIFFFLEGPARKGVRRYFYYSGILFVFSWFFLYQHHRTLRASSLNIISTNERTI